MKGQIEWLLDSGCTDHIINTEEYFDACETLEKPVKVKIGDGTILENNRRKAEEILEIVHTDVNGPHQTTGYNGEKYFLSFIDDYSCGRAFVAKDIERSRDVTSRARGGAAAQATIATRVGVSCYSSLEIE
ncbi:unnamed protein product [Arctia plantaginis]|uniref:Retrovirus-related Pol polyprotein from transposon TNT 1-94-like beta-barrel domain-containing protein n=1 Tax=Arctia plantaginis TaxID=874455 RepID=A0A8S1B1J8_ARCPL|nr:unnamed protein product [Arctia plantaginis]